MALVLADRVRDTTTTVGTADLVLSGTAPVGFQNFSVVGNGNTTYYTVTGGSQWEVGIGTYSATGPTLARTTVLSSSAGGTKVSFAAGTKSVFVTYPAERAVDTDTLGASTGASLVGQIASGTGAVARTVQSKLRDYVSAEDFGAVGDGVTNDSVAISNALQYCSDTGTPFYGRGGATYRIASSITINRTNGEPLVIDWCGAKVVLDGYGIGFIGSSTAYLNTTLATEIDRDDAFINLTSVTGIAKGDLLEILSPALTCNTIGTYHYYVINEVIGNNVYIEGTTVADVKNQQIIDSGQVGSITVAAYKVSAPVTMKNATFEIVDPTGATISSGVNFEWHSKVELGNIIFTGKCRAQLRIFYTGEVDVGSCTFRDFGYTEADSGYVNLPGAPGGQSYGYGLLVSRVWQTLFHDNIGLRGWHTVDFSRGSMKALVSDCSFSRNAFGVSTHEGAWYTEIRNCMFDGNNGVTLWRGAYGIVEGCHFKGLTGIGIVYADTMVDVRIANNKIEYNPGVTSVQSAVYYTTATGPRAGVMSTGFPRVFELIGNTIIGSCRCYAGFNDSATGSLVLADNSFLSQAILQGVYAAKNTYIRNNTFSDIGQFGFNLLLGSGNPSVVCNGNSQSGAVATFSNSALFFLTGSGTPVLHFENNSTQTQYLLRFMSNITVKSVVNCAGRAERLFLGTGTVTNAINNYYVTIVAATTTVTNSVNNNALV